MTDQDERDRQIHENLQRLSQHLVFPEQPSDQKRDQWQALLSERQPGPRIVARGANLMRRHGTLTMIGSGALAASLLAAIFLVNTIAPRVSADMILTELRLALGRSLLIEFRNIKLDYAELAAHIPASQLKHGTVCCAGSVFVPNRPTQEAFWTMDDIRMRDLSVSPDGAGGFSADAEMTACLRDENPWFFFRASDAPAVDPAEFGPQAVLLRAVRGGVYVTLPSLAFQTQEGDHVLIFSPEFSNLRDLQHVLGRLDEIATNITVEEVEEGSFVLTAEGFRDGVALPVPEDSQLSASTRQGMEAWLRDKMKNQTVEVGYRLNEGIDWISVRNFGTPDGSIDIQVGDIGFDDRLLELDFHLGHRPAPVVDASALLALVDMFDHAAGDEPE